MILEFDDCVLLIDPMLGKKGTMPSLSFLRCKSQRNPIVELPYDTFEVLERVTHCLITHKHKDHIDKAGEEFLRKNNVPIVCAALDEDYLRKRGLKVIQSVAYWKKSTFLNGSIIGIPAKHGYGFIAKPMGNVMGYLIKIPSQPSVYLSSDTIFTEEVKKTLKEFKPEVSVVACGSAQLDIGKPLLMHLDDIVSFVNAAEGKVIANHMEAVNHCPTTRKQLAERLTLEGIQDKVIIPEDGEIINLAH